MSASLPNCPGALGPVEPGTRDAVAAALRAAPGAEALAWLEKLRRFASLYGRRLRGVAKDRFGGQAEAHLSWMAEALLAGARHHPERGAAPMDAACLNGALFCRDAQTSPGALGGRCDEAVAELEAWLTRTSAQPPAVPAMGPELALEPGRWAGEAAACEPLVLISPNPYSLFSVVVLELCLRLGLPVKAILLRRFTPGRFTEELRRDGVALLTKRIWRKLVLKADENADATDVSMTSLLEGLRPHHRDIRRTAGDFGIPVIAASRFSDAVGALGVLGAATALFTGGGLIAPEVIGCFSRGIINTHMGHLPQYKGMDVVQAPILEGRFDSIGLTTHYMAPALDAGPVLGRFTIPMAPYPTLGALRNVLSAVMPLLLVDSVLGAASGRLRPEPQLRAGRQYYFVHPGLNEVIGSVFAAARPHREAGTDLQRAIDSLLADPALQAHPAAAGQRRAAS